VRTGSSARRESPTGGQQPGDGALVGAVQAGVEPQVLARPELAVQQRLVGQQPDPPPHLPAVAGQRAAQDARLAAVGT
jgi:hypothetical protein